MDDFRSRTSAPLAGLSPRVRRGAVVVVGVIVFALGLWVFIKLLPEQLASTSGITDPSERGQEIGRVRTAVLASLAGILAAIGAYYTHRSFGLNREALELSRQGQITERFTRAVDQLGNDNSIDVRLGGIYALERLARESRADHSPIVEILTAYVREHSRRRPDDDDSDPATKMIATDIQAVLTVLGRRTLAHDGVPLDLRRAHLKQAFLVRAHLERAVLVDAHLEGAILAEAHLEGAHLERALLTEANLDRADLRRAHLKGANLGGAYLEGANLDGAYLEGANLDGAHLRGATWSENTVWPQGLDPGRLAAEES